MAEKLDTQTRREQIAEAALELIGRTGVRGLSLAAVARRVGLVPSAIYRHFKGREEVLDAVIDLVPRRLQANVAAVLGETESSLERLERLAGRHVRLIQENQVIPRLLFSEEVHLERPHRRAAVWEALRGYTGGIADIVREGQSRGEIRPELDPGTVSILFLGLVQPAAVFWLLSDGKFDATEHLAKAWEIFRAAVEREPRAPAKGRRKRVREPS
ncbi:MAG: TetR/AcrR family transcriptional regulator [Deltaproteobacteria bacterium]|nr:TetR/AcrR family transcriptional regulator [Deltaproteobacteria bacterium]